LKDQVEKDALPARLTDHPSNWQCRFCQYKDICKMTDENEITWEDFKKKLV